MNKSNNNKTKRKLDLLNRRLEMNDKRTYPIDNNPNNNKTKQAREQQERQSKSKNSKILYNVHREIDIKESSDGSKDKTKKESNLNVDSLDIHKETKVLKQK